MAIVDATGANVAAAKPTLPLAESFVLQNTVDMDSASLPVASGDTVKAIAIPAKTAVTHVFVEPIVASTAATSAVADVRVGATNVLAATNLKNAAGTISGGMAAIGVNSSANASTVDIVPTFTGAGLKGKYKVSAVCVQLG